MEYIFLLALLTCVILFLVSFYTPRTVKFLKAPSKLKGILFWFSMTTICFFGLYAAIPDSFKNTRPRQNTAAQSQAKAPVAPPSVEEQLASYLAAVKSVDKSITDVQLWSQGDDRKTLGIFYTKDIAFKIFYTIGMNCENISKELVKKQLIDDKMTVLYFVHVPTIDKLGNEGTGLAIKIAWDGATLQKINWKNMFAPDFMNLCESVELRPVLRQDFVEFAQDKDNQKDFPGFIRMVLSTNKNL